MITILHPVATAPAGPVPSHYVNNGVNTTSGVNIPSAPRRTGGRPAQADRSRISRAPRISPS